MIVLIFTLVIVAVIFSILVTSIFTVFKGSLDSWRKAETILDMYQNARFALDMMEREISTAYLYQDSANTAYWTKFEGYLAGAGLKTNSKAATREIFFVAPIAANPGRQDLCEVGYWLRDDNRLMRHFEPFGPAGMPVAIPVVYDFSKRADGSVDTGASDTTVATNITALTFTYYYRNTNVAGSPPTGTVTTWNSGLDTLTGVGTENYDSAGNKLIPDGLPDAVAVSITVQNKDGSQSRTFTDFIRIVGAR